MTKEVFALSAVRSAVGGFGGSLSGLSPEELGSQVAKEAFARAGVDPQQATYAVVGNVIPCGFSFPYVPRRVTIGAGTFIGAGAVVVADLPAGVVAYGVPARVVRPND